MTILVVGATGMTGRLVVEQLLEKGHEVRVIVRSPDKYSAEILKNPSLAVVEAAILDLSDEALADLVADCHAVVSCLGHVMDFRGVFGKPRRLCTDAAQRLCSAIEKNNPREPTKFILMNTVGVKNPQCDEPRTWIERGLLFLLRYTLPPHKDNETAAEHLHENIGKNSHHIEWCSVRPDSLIDAEISPYEIEKSPVTGILSGRPTSRANVASFMVELIENVNVWSDWKFQMPVIMNAEE